MRVESISICEHDLMFAVAGQLFDQAPNRQPRNAEIIMHKIRDSFRKDAYNFNEYYSLEIPKNNIHGYIETLLKAIPEFIELNLSQIEYEKKVSVNDEDRPKYAISIMYDKNDSESWKKDFIDLDAFIRNVYGRLFSLINSNQDCVLCKNRKTKKCNNCTINPDLTYNYECSREPHGVYTFSCKYDCKEHCQICCEECNKKDSCVDICDGSSKTCGNVAIDLRNKIDNAEFRRYRQWFDVVYGSSEISSKNNKKGGK